MKQSDIKKMLLLLQEELELEVYEQCKRSTKIRTVHSAAKNTVESLSLDMLEKLQEEIKSKPDARIIAKYSNDFKRKLLDNFLDNKIDKPTLRSGIKKFSDSFHAELFNAFKKEDSDRIKAIYKEVYENIINSIGNSIEKCEMSATSYNRIVNTVVERITNLDFKENEPQALLQELLEKVFRSEVLSDRIIETVSNRLLYRIEKEDFIERSILDSKFFQSKITNIAKENEKKKKNARGLQYINRMGVPEKKPLRRYVSSGYITEEVDEDEIPF